MLRLMTVSAVIVLVVSQSVATAQESTRAEFDEYCKAMVGTWHCNLTVRRELPGIAKEGDKLEVRAVNKLAADGNAIVGHGSDGAKAGATSLTYYDAEKKQIKGTTVFTAGTVAHNVATKQGDGKWVAVRIIVNPDGTKAESKSTLVITDDGNTHTWTEGGVSNIWRRVKK